MKCECYFGCSNAIGRLVLVDILLTRWLEHQKRLNQRRSARWICGLSRNSAVLIVSELCTVPTPPGKSWMFSWKFQDPESPENILECYARKTSISSVAASSWWPLLNSEQLTGDILLHAQFSAMAYTLNILSKYRFFCIFKHSWAPKSKQVLENFYATLFRLSSSSLCMECIVAKRCVLEQKLLLRAIGSRIWEIDWYQSEWPWPMCRGRFKVTSTIALHLTLNISETVRDRALVPKDHQ